MAPTTADVMEAVARMQAPSRTLRECAEAYRAHAVPMGTAGPETILEEARRIVDGDRRQDYGHPSENHGMTAALWTAYLGVDVTARDVCLLNILQKVSREGSGAPKRDNLVDIAGFARNAEIVSQVAEGGVDPAAPGGDRTVLWVAPGDDVAQSIRESIARHGLRTTGGVPHTGTIQSERSDPNLYETLREGLGLPVRFSEVGLWGSRLDNEAPNKSSIGSLVVCDDTLAAIIGVDGPLDIKIREFRGMSLTVTQRQLSWASPGDARNCLKARWPREYERSLRGNGPPMAPRTGSIESLDAAVQAEGGHNVTGEALKDIPEVPAEIVDGLTMPVVPGDPPLKAPVRFAGKERWGRSLREMAPSESSAGCLVRTHGGILCMVLGGLDEFQIATVRIWKGLRTRTASYNLHWASPDEVDAFVRDLAARRAPDAATYVTAPEPTTPEEMFPGATPSPAFPRDAVDAAEERGRT